jgi:hypothetical protein
VSTTNQQPPKQTPQPRTERASVRSIPRQTLFREVNERIEELAEEFGAGTGPISLLCECANSGCLERIEISAADYKQVRRFPTRFLVKQGHLDRQTERIVRETSRYDIVEKTGPDATEAVRLDPRRAALRAGGSR